jgi:hypothetical protein
MLKQTRTAGVNHRSLLALCTDSNDIGYFQNLSGKNYDLVIFLAAANATAAPHTNINAPPTTRL